MKANIGLPFIVVAALINLSACGYVKSLFPDKEKDYQFTTEIKPLVIPSDLKDNSVFKRSDGSVSSASESETNDLMQADVNSEAAAGMLDHAGASPENSAVAETSIERESTATEQARPDSQSQVAGLAPDGSENSAETSVSVQQPSKQQAPDSDETPIELVVYDDGESRLRIGAETARAWRLVGKALSRNSIEVISRNQEQASFEVQYDPDEKRVEDGTLWDEVKFIFGGVQAKDKQYLMKLIGHDQQTDVAVLDQDGKPATNGAGLRLLKLIQKTLKADQSD